MRKYITLLLISASRLCFANMASPYSEGTKVSSAFSSRNIDILNERIWVTVDRKFESASYVIEYNIKTDTGGRQIPLLFYAENYKSDFKVWVDGMAVELLNIPDKYTNVLNSPFQSFANSFEKSSMVGRPLYVTINWNEHWAQSYKLSDLKYFNAILEKGKHQVRVEYTAGPWGYRGNWIKQYSFNYSLSPAHNWRSFGALQIMLITQNFRNGLTTNLGTPNHISGTTQTWNFDKLPGDAFIISHTPLISGFASVLLFIGPFGMTLIFTALLIIIHFILIIRVRKAKPLKKYLGVTIFGSLLIPLLFLIGYIFSFDIIDNLIGDDASRYHGYVFMLICLYPFVMLPYWLVMWLIDRSVKKRIPNFAVK